MLTVALDEPDLIALEFFRVAISEDTKDSRKMALSNLFQQLEAWQLAGLARSIFWRAGVITPTDGFSRWMLDTTEVRGEASISFRDTCARYKKKFERKLNIAEHIGKQVWFSIADEEFRGLQSPQGILRSVQEKARELNVSGGRDKDVLRKIWKTYRGVVHLGMAMDFCEDESLEGKNILEVAEEMRWQLSHNAPNGTKKPYVDEAEQISFVFNQ